MEKRFDGITAGTVNVVAGRHYSINWKQQFTTNVTPALGDSVATDVYKGELYTASVIAPKTGQVPILLYFDDPKEIVSELNVYPVH